MNHYCTALDRNYLPQGLALWRSLAAHDPDAVLWVLAWDDFTADVLRKVGGTWLCVVELAKLEAADPEVAATKATRTRVEYFFTLSPCWARWLLAHGPDIDRVTKLDADTFFFGSPAEIFAEMDAMGASVLLTEHRFSRGLEHYRRHGRFNAGFISWRNDPTGRAVLDDWRERCLAWCHDRLEEGRFADQGYLDAWPERWGAAVKVLDHPGVNFAPWNWAAQPWTIEAAGQSGASRITVDGRPLVQAHFARFHALRGDWWWRSGQLDYGVMPARLRNALYVPYWRALKAARAELTTRRPDLDVRPRAGHGGRGFWRELPLRILFGSDWLRVGDRFVSGRLGLGRFSGRFLAWLRRRFGRGPA